MMLLLRRHCTGVVLLLVGSLGLVCCHNDNDMSNDVPDIHGGVKMGVKDINCDDGIHNLVVDWDGSDDAYTCPTDTWLPIEQQQPWSCAAVCERVMPPYHRCLNVALHYNEDIPTSGPHRPIWPHFGEYRYVPVQRWLHNLEHGCAVFLYHPCAPQSDIDKLRHIATHCLRKHIITPYNLLPRDLPFAVVTYGCKLQLPYVNETAVVDFVKDHTLNNAPEADNPKNGGFSVELITPALIVSDRDDSEICPQNPVMLPDFEPSTVAPVVVKGQHTRHRKGERAAGEELQSNDV